MHFLIKSGAPPMVRSLHVISSMSLTNGGPTQSLARLCEALNAMGAPAEIATIHHAGGTAIKLSLTPVHTFPVGFPAMLRRSPDLSRFLETAAPRFDLLHVHGVWEWPGFRARQVALRHGLPLVISPRGSLEPWPLRQRPLLKRLALWTWEGRNLKSCRLLHATAETEAAQFRKLGLTADCCVVPNALDLPIELPPRSSTPPYTLLFFSRFHPKKGVDLLIQAWARLHPRFPEWNLELVGPDQDDYQSQMAAFARSLNVPSHRIRFGGPVYGEEKAKLLARSSLFVLPTHSENFGNVVPEALAHGLPVITTVCAPWEGLVRHRCGWWISRDLQALERSLEEAFLLPDAERAAMGERGRAWVTQEFSPSSVATRMLEAYTLVTPPARAHR